MKTRNRKNTRNFRKLKGGEGKTQEALRHTVGEVSRNSIKKNTHTFKTY